MDHDWLVRNIFRDNFIKNIIGYNTSFELVPMRIFTSLFYMKGSSYLRLRVLICAMEIIFIRGVELATLRPKRFR